jgi:hypothetical protein
MLFNHSIKGSPMDKPPYVRQTRSINSRGAATGAATKPITSMKYTGEAMLGTATMHKSNGVPVFSKESIVDINRMRRG